MTSITPATAAPDERIEARGEQAPSGELVTVVVPARNEERFIASCLDSIRQQTHTNLQIIVIDGASDDGTAEVVRSIARADKRVELIHNPDRVIPRSLNLAVAAAQGNWLVRVDAHATVPPGYVERALHHLVSGSYGAVGGRKDGVGLSPAGRAIAVAMASKFGVGDSFYHYGDRPRTVDHVPFGCYPTQLIRQLGGWDEELAVNQDFEFDYRVGQAGHELLFDPELRIDWHCRQSIPDLFRQYRRYGRGKVAVARKHPSSVHVRQTVPPLLVAALATAAVVAPRRPGIAAVIVSPYLAFVACGSARERARLHGDRPAQLRLPAAFVAMHVGWGIGFWQGVVQHLQRLVWNTGRSRR